MDADFPRWLFAQTCTFVAGAAQLEQLPPPSLVEVAFCGRSNVGKSSLVNALTGRKTLARTSHTPGRTQQLNFFNLGEKMMLVDLPGYGYAQVGRAKVKLWSEVIDAYLQGRQTLGRAFVLIDARHGLKDSDEAMMKRLDEAAVSYQVILTKTDKAKGLDAVVARAKAQIAKHPAAHPEIITTSSHKDLGIAELRAAIARLVIDLGSR